MKSNAKTLVNAGKTTIKTAANLAKNNAQTKIENTKVAVKTIGSAAKSLWNGDIIGASKTIANGSK